MNNSGVHLMQKSANKLAGLNIEQAFGHYQDLIELNKDSREQFLDY